MCLAIPGKIKKILPDKRHAVIVFSGVENEVNIELISPKINAWVIVHAGFAIQTLTAKDAKQTLKLLKVTSKCHSALAAESRK